MKIVQEQYKLVQSARVALFSFLSTLPFSLLQAEMETADNKSICYLLNHVATSYLSWLNEFARNIPLVQTDETTWQRMEDITKRFAEVDAAVDHFLSAFNNPDEIITALKKRQNLILSLSVLQLFTHVITHEFHHKGVIVNLTRQLGFTPIDTDIIRF